MGFPNILLLIPSSYSESNSLFVFGQIVWSDLIWIVNVKPSFAETRTRFSFRGEWSTGRNGQFSCILLAVSVTPCMCRHRHSIIVIVVLITSKSNSDTLNNCMNDKLTVSQPTICVLFTFNRIDLTIHIWQNSRKYLFSTALL